MPGSRSFASLLPPHADKRSTITSDPNRPDAPEYIVRLVGQVVRVSVETVAIVNTLPADYGTAP